MKKKEARKQKHERSKKLMYSQREPTYESDHMVDKFGGNYCKKP